MLGKVLMCEFFNQVFQCERGSYKISVFSLLARRKACTVCLIFVTGTPTMLIPIKKCLDKNVLVLLLIKLKLVDFVFISGRF